jgi:threonine/homoserine/homoserine lactone efflux protein
MTMSSTAGSLALTGFILGWSVAWPPGPINAEAIRRGLSRRVWPAYAVVVGGCLGDALWALVVGVGTGALLRVAHLTTLLGVISVALLVVLAGLFLRGAWRRYADHRAGTPSPASRSFNNARGSLVLGLTLAATGPWNLAFWLAVLGQPGNTAHGIAGSVVVACGVLVGALTWGLILCVSVAWLGARFATPSWEIVTQLGTGVLMLFFAARTALRLMGV